MTPKPGPVRKMDACTNPEKLHAWPTMKLAQAGMIKVLGNMVVHDHQGPMPIRVYRCPCGWWHMTHKPRTHKETA